MDDTNMTPDADEVVEAPVMEEGAEVDAPADDQKEEEKTEEAS